MKPRIRLREKASAAALGPVLCRTVTFWKYYSDQTGPGTGEAAHTAASATGPRLYPLEANSRLSQECWVASAGAVEHFAR